MINTLLNKSYHKGPRFICIGPEKTGTSWLYANLSPHPDVFLPPVKEIRYFYEISEYHGEGVIDRLSGKGDWHAQDYREYVRERVEYYREKPYRLLREWRRLLWDYQFIVGRRTNSWYLSLFKDAGERLAGDISPQYFSIPDDQIKNMLSLLPSTKIIILLRDPIEWSWSFARMSLIGDKNLHEISDHNITAFFDRYMNYYPTLSAIKRWQHYVPIEQLYIGFYDLLVNEPLRFYKEICVFLDIDENRTPQSVWASMSKRINEGRMIPLPERFAIHLAQNWKPEIEQLCQAFSPYPQKWLRRCNDIINQ